MEMEARLREFSAWGPIMEIMAAAVRRHCRVVDKAEQLFLSDEIVPSLGWDHGSVGEGP